MEVNYYNQAKYSNISIDGVKHISVEETKRLMDSGDAYFIDVRPEIAAKQTYFEFQNVFNIPLQNLPDKLSVIPKEIIIICVCTSGFDSTKAVNFFNRNGYKDVYNMDGGIIEWKNKGFPIIETKYDESVLKKLHSQCKTGCKGCS